MEYDTMAIEFTAEHLGPFPSEVTEEMEAKIQSVDESNGLTITFVDGSSVTIG